MENTTGEHLTGAIFAQHVEACLAIGAPVALPKYGEYIFALILDHPGPPDVVHFIGTRVGTEGGTMDRQELGQVIGSFSTAHTPLDITVQPLNPEAN